MPANVTYEFEKARINFEQAASPEAKLAALLEMQRASPSHKGGENLRKDISQKIAAVKREMERKKLQDKKSGGKSISVPKEGIGQVVLVGMPNSGKSTLLKALAGVEVEIAPYEFTTTKPVVGAMDFHGAKVQLVEIPAIVEGSSCGKFNGLQLLAVIRNADAVVLVVRDKEKESILMEELAKAGILLNEKKPKVKIMAGSYKGISIAGKKFLKCREKELVQFLKGAGCINASVILNEPTDLKLVSRALNESLCYKNAISVNVFKGLEVKKVKRQVFEMLGKVLIYTKKPGREVDYTQPLAVPKGTSVGQAAKHLHKDFSNMKYAKLWGSSKYQGQRVPKEYELKNFDILEIYC